MASRVVEHQSRSAFEAELRRLGYAAAEPFEYDPCPHRATDACAVFVMPTREVKEEAETYGQLGWLVYEGCEPCCMGCASVLFCGGMFTHLRIFVGGVLTESSGDAALHPADAPLEDDDDAPEA